MIECSVSELCAATGATLVAGAGDERVAGCSIDSRKLGAGELFVAFIGERVDGNDFAAAALEAGAGAVALTRAPTGQLCALAAERSAALLRVEGDDATEFLLLLAAWWRERQDWCVVGITGSVGKTTTKDMLAAALAATYRVHATKGNHNNLIGVPLTLLEAPTTSEVLVVEMGMNHPGEIARLASVARPRFAAITNIGTSHIGLLGSREDIARAKAEVVATLPSAPPSSVAPAPRLFLCAENDYTSFIVEEFARVAGVDVTLVGEGRGSAVVATNITLDEEAHPSFDVRCLSTLGDAAAGSSFHESLALTGAQVVSDFLFALAMALELGVPARAALSQLAELVPARMRQEVVHASCGCRIIDDTYNASPDSTAAALDALCGMHVSEGARRIAILGEIGELGSEEGRLHELVGAYAAAKPLDLLVAVGTSGADHLSRAALLMGLSADRLVRVSDVDALTQVVAPMLAPDDLVLVKASRAAHLDRFVKAVRS